MSSNWSQSLRAQTSTHVQGRSSQHRQTFFCGNISTVKAFSGVEFLLPGVHGCPKVACFFFSTKKVECCGFALFAGSSSIIPFAASAQLCRSTIRTNTPCGVRYVACHVQAALSLSFLGPPWSQWCSDRCALGVLQQWLSVASVCRTFMVG